MSTNYEVDDERDELHLISLASVKAEPVEWLFEPFIPLGKLTILEGDPGLGKTMMALQIIARLTKGEPVLSTNLDDGNETSNSEPINVIFQTAEDSLADTIKPRLIAAGADCDRVLVIDDKEKALTLSDDRLEQALIATNARLVVLDPIQGFLGREVDMHRANEVRPVLSHLAELATSYHCAMLLIGHINKTNSAKALYRGLGSIDFHAAARSVLLIGRMKDEPDVRVMVQTKNSLAPEGKPMAFAIGAENGFHWLGPCELTADELLSGASRGERSREAERFLKEILANGPMAQRQLEVQAESQGLKMKTLRNVKKQMGVQSLKRGNEWFWCLPQNEAQDDDADDEEITEPVAAADSTTLTVRSEAPSETPVDISGSAIEDESQDDN